VEERRFSAAFSASKNGRLGSVALQIFSQLLQSFTWRIDIPATLRESKALKSGFDPRTPLDIEGATSRLSKEVHCAVPSLLSSQCFPTNKFHFTKPDLR
jgi:hypothetical protein